MVQSETCIPSSREKARQRRGGLACVPSLYQMCTKRAETGQKAGRQVGCSLSWVVVCVRKVKGILASRASQASRSWRLLVGGLAWEVGRWGLWCVPVASR